MKKKLRSHLSSRRRGGVAQEFLDHTTPPSATPPPAEDLLRRGARPSRDYELREAGNKSMGHIAAPPRTTRSAVLPINRRSRNPCP